ncbi:MAG: PRTRC system ThiF family protein [Rhizobium sp.]|nr:MAG: PRTRC system ThiF family protein [Rhizobium sp.]
MKRSADVRFALPRTDMLILGPTTGTFSLPERWLSQCRVLVLGCGGSGSEVVDGLARVHHVLVELGHPGLDVVLQDGAVVRPSNCGRQRFLPSDVGQNKAQVLAARYGSLMAMPIRAVTRPATANSISEMSHHFELVISAVDKAEFRVRLCDYWAGRRTETMLLDLGNGAAIGQVVFGHLGAPAKGDRLPNVLDLFPDIRFANDDAEPSCSVEESIRSQHLGVNRLMADAAVFTVLAELFTQGQITTHGAFVDLSKPAVAPIRIDRTVWASMGYAQK